MNVLCLHRFFQLHHLLLQGFRLHPFLLYGFQCIFRWLGSFWLVRLAWCFHGLQQIHKMRDGFASVSIKRSSSCFKKVACEVGAGSNPSKRPLILSQRSSIFCEKSTNTIIIFVPETRLLLRWLSNNLALLITLPR